MNATQAEPPQLTGLLLAGGKSRRMGSDKASLPTPEGPLWRRTWRLLKTVCPQSFLSIRPGQEIPDIEQEEASLLFDPVEGRGPLGGILHALEQNPSQAVLVLACDLPLLDRVTLQALVAARAPGQLATAYRSEFDGLPEPLCAIYEPAAAPFLRERLGGDHPCPRKFLIQNRDRVALLDLPIPHALENANTPEDLSRINSLS